MINHEKRKRRVISSAALALSGSLALSACASPEPQQSHETVEAIVKPALDKMGEVILGNKDMCIEMPAGESATTLECISSTDFGIGKDVVMVDAKFDKSIYEPLSSSDIVYINIQNTTNGNSNTMSQEQLYSPNGANFAVGMSSGKQEWAAESETNLAIKGENYLYSSTIVDTTARSSADNRSVEARQVTNSANQDFSIYRDGLAA